jgi:hypothetical protein
LVAELMLFSVSESLGVSTAVSFTVSRSMGLNSWQIGFENQVWQKQCHVVGNLSPPFPPPPNLPNAESSLLSKNSFLPTR